MGSRMAKDYILAIDQGTTSSRAIMFDGKLQPLATAQQEFTQHFPQSGWVEHDPEDLFSSCIDMCRQLLQQNGFGASDIAAIGITVPRWLVKLKQCDDVLLLPARHLSACGTSYA